jgi:hypothetical protein
MLRCGDETYIQDNGNGYDLYTRQVVCSNCIKVIGKQEKYCGIDKDFKFTQRQDLWDFCPFCGEKLK